MEEIVLSATRRELTGKKVKQLRRAGLIPAVLYGRQTDSIPLTLPKRRLEEAIAAAGSTHLIKLYLDEAEPKMALLRQVQRDTLSHEIIHADFYQVSMTETITTEVPIVLVGVSPAVDRGLGMLLQGMNSVEVECLPGDLISEITVDVSKLVELHQTITVADLQLGKGITILADPEEMVVTVTALREEEAEKVEEVEVTKAEEPAPRAARAEG